MTNPAAPIARSGHSNAPQGTERFHILIVLVEDRPGAVDRVVGVLRRRRAHTESLNLAQSGTSDIVRITAQVKDSEVVIDHLVEQLRKVVDVREIVNLPAQEAVTRELALIKVNAAERLPEIVQIAYHYNAYIVDAHAEAVTLEVSGDAEKLEQAIQALHPFGIREIARSGSVAIARSTTAV